MGTFWQRKQRGDWIVYGVIQQKKTVLFVYVVIVSKTINEGFLL